MIMLSYLLQLLQEQFSLFMGELFNQNDCLGLCEIGTWNTGLKDMIKQAN